MSLRHTLYASVCKLPVITTYSYFLKVNLIFILLVSYNYGTFDYHFHTVTLSFSRRQIPDFNEQTSNNKIIYLLSDELHVVIRLTAKLCYNILKRRNTLLLQDKYTLRLITFYYVF